MRLITGALLAAVAAATQYDVDKPIQMAHIFPETPAAGRALRGVDLPVVNYTTLTVGTPYVDSIMVPLGTPDFTLYNYYRFNLAAGVDYKVIIMNYEGDVDLFVGDPNCPVPTVSTYNFSCATDFTEVVSITGAQYPNGGMFYAGVTPWAGQNSTYSIVVQTSSVTTLLDGIPLDYYLTINDEQHFTITVTPMAPTDTWLLSISAMYGDPDTFITLNDASGNYPGPTNYQYAETGGNGEDLIAVSASDPQFQARCPLNQPCKVLITVRGFTSAYYSIVWRSKLAPGLLVTGLPQVSTVQQGQYLHFNYTMPQNAALSIAVTSIGGDADLYVSGTPYPTQFAYTWSSASIADEVVIVKTNDPSYIGGGGTYYISVFGWSSNVTFSITAALILPNATQSYLLDGVPQAGQGDAHTMTYYAFNISNTYPGGFRPRLDVFGAAVAGNIDIYVSNITTFVNGKLAPVYPQPRCGYYSSTGKCLVWNADPATYSYSSSAYGSQDFISIPAVQLNLGQQLIVAVLASTPDAPDGTPAPPSVFSVTATTSGSVTDLQNGVEVPGEVLASAYKYYRFVATQFGQDLLVSATVSNGGLDIFVAESSTTTRPVFGNSTWNTTSSGGGILRDRIVYIPFTSMSATCRSWLSQGIPCTFYIGVRGYPNMGTGVVANYMISADTAGSTYAPFVLSNGRPFFTFIPKGLYAFFYALVSIPATQSVFVTVQNFGGSSLLYINMGVNKTFWTPGSGTQPDVLTPDVGGFERAIITPAYMRNGPRVLHLNADNTTGYVTVRDPEAELLGVPGARVVEQLPRGGAVLEVPVGHLQPKPFYSAPVPVSDNGVVRDHVDPYSIEGAKVHPANEANNGQLSEKMRAVREALVTAPGADTLEVPEATVQRAAEDPDMLGSPFYCNQCAMYITVGAQQDTSVIVTYTGGSTVTELLGDTPVQGFSPALGYSYFSFSTTDPVNDVVISVQQTFAPVDVYISVQSPTAAWLMPGQQNYKWAFFPWLGMTRVNISHTDPNFCMPADNTRVGAPCTYLIAVRSRNNRTATYTISASSDAQPLTVLEDGAPVAGRVYDGGVHYYLFQAGPDNYPTPSTILTWTNLMGSVVLYATNAFDPNQAVSITNPLPGPGVTSICQWYQPNMTALFMGAGDPCYDYRKHVYTIAVVGATGFPGVSSSYELTATVSGDPRRLVFGVPTTNIFAPYQMNLNFTFDLWDTTTDLIISASPTYGNVGVMVAHDDPAGDLQPYCYQPYPGAQFKCTGYTWFSTGVGENVIYIPAANPCQPIVPPGTVGPVVNASCTSNDFRLGRYLVVVFSTAGFSELSLSVTTVGSPITLPDGQPQDMQTGALTLCPGNRNIFSGQCTGDPTSWTIAQGATFTFRTPSTQTPMDNYLILEKLCGGNNTGACGPNLHVYVTACTMSNCTPDSQFPYAGNSVSDIVASDATASLRIPYNLCWGSAQPQAMIDCVYSIAVYPICGNPQLPPGQGCPPTVFRLTQSGGTGIERVSSDCFGIGKTCTLPEQSVPYQGVKRYEANAADGGAVKVVVSAQVCTGSLTLYLCMWGGSCNPFTTPSPYNFDYSAAPDAHGTASIQLSLASLFYVGVRGMGNPGLAQPSFQLALKSGSGPTLVLNPFNPSPLALRDSTQTQITVVWDQVYIYANGQQPVIPTNVIYTVYLFPQGTTGQSRLDTPCGVADAWGMGIAGSYQSTSMGSDAMFFGVSATTTYSVAVVATCPGGSCMPGNNEAQSVALYPTTSVPGAPNPSVSPTAVPSKTPSGPGGGGSSSTSVVGAVIGSLVGVGVAIGGFFAYKRFFSGPGGPSFSFSMPSFSFGGSGSGGRGGTGSSRYGFVPSTDTDAAAMFTSSSALDAGDAYAAAAGLVSGPDSAYASLNE